MEKHYWNLKNGYKAIIHFSAHFDNIITKYKDGKLIEGVFLMDCGIVKCMPRIMRYCFEENINLRERPSLKKLNHRDFSEINEERILSDFKIPLRDDIGAVKSVLHKLVLTSSPSEVTGEISFNKSEVPELVEKIIESLDYEPTILTKIKCEQTVQYYHQCLDNEII